MISKRAFARRVASIHIASNIDYENVDAISFSEDNLADEMASVLYNLVTQTPLWRKSEKILVGQFLSEGEDAFLGRRSRRRGSLVHRLSSQISNRDIVTSLNNLYDEDEMLDLASQSELEDIVKPFTSSSEEEGGGMRQAYSRASSFLKESVLPIVARRYFPKYLASKISGISERNSFREERAEARARQKAKDLGLDADTPVRRRVAPPSVKVRSYFNTMPLVSEIESEIRKRTFTALTQDQLLSDMVEEAEKYTDFSGRNSVRARRLRDNLEKEAKKTASDIVKSYLRSLDSSMFEEDLGGDLTDETRVELFKGSAKYLKGMTSRLESLSASIIKVEVLKEINQMNFSAPLTQDELDDINSWEAKYR